MRIFKTLEPLCLRLKNIFFQIGIQKYGLNIYLPLFHPKGMDITIKKQIVEYLEIVEELSKLSIPTRWVIHFSTSLAL